MRKYVIIGNGAAGANAADEIRKLDPECGITIFTEEAYSFYYRPKLSEFLAGKNSMESFTMHNGEYYQNRNIDLRLNTKIDVIDPQKKTVTDSKGVDYSYDELLIAAGAKSNIPPLPGTDKKNIFTMRTIDDTLRLKEAAEKAKNTRNVLLVGGGLLGLEVGKGLIELGLKVEVIEFLERLLPRQMDIDGAAILQAQLEKQGFSFHLGAKVKEVTGKNSAAEGLLLEDGRQLSADLILFSAGIKPNLDLAKSMAQNIVLKIQNSIVVDKHMRTSIPHIFAAGDVAEYNGIPCGIWPVAMQQGKCAGINMTGKDYAYQVVLPSTTLKVAGINLVSTGNIDAENKLKAAVCKNGENYRKIVFGDNGTIQGFIFMGNTDGVKQCTVAMNNSKQVDTLYEEMQKEDFNFNRLM